MDTTDEIPLEDHRYFSARLDHLESQQPVVLLNHLEQGTLTQHLRDVTMRAMQAKANLVFNQNIPEDQADELVMNQVVADPKEHGQLNDPSDRLKLRLLLNPYRSEMPDLPRTYQSVNEIIE
jgi:hypothetical protein